MRGTLLDRVWRANLGLFIRSACAKAFLFSLKSIFVHAENHPNNKKKHSEILSHNSSGNMFVYRVCLYTCFESYVEKSSSVFRFRSCFYHCFFHFYHCFWDFYPQTNTYLFDSSITRRGRLTNTRCLAST